MPSLNCYFHMNMEEPEETRFVQSFCEACAQASDLKDAYFWQGSIRGYGQYKISCTKCNIQIYNPEE